MSFGFNTGAWMHSWMGWQDPGLPGNYTNEKDQEIIGVKDAVLFWISNYGTGTNSAAGGGFTATTFDVTSYSNGAIVKLNNDSGGDRKMKAVCIYGKPVVRYSGEQSAIHDEFVDYDSIVRDGEKKLEFSNNYIVTKAQLEQLCDFYWKANNYKRHTYELEIPGRCYWFCPGEWYTVQIGAAGQPEYIDSVCECYDVQIEAEAGGLGRSVVAFREVYQNWTKDSGALARFLGSGSPKDKYNFSRVLVASQYYPGPSDFRCDGTADQTEIQAAIDQVAGFGGGVVELTEGTFNIAAEISMSYDNVVLMGAGTKTVLNRNCAAHCIAITGTSGTHLKNQQIINLAVQAADSQNEILIDINYADSFMLDKLYVGACATVGLEIQHSNNWAFINSEVTANAGINLAADCTGHIAHNINIHDCAGGALSVSGQEYVISGNRITDNNVGIYAYDGKGKIIGNVVTGSLLWGISVQSTYPVLVDSCVLLDNAQQSGAGIYISTDTVGSIISNNYCEDNGNLIEHRDCEESTAPPSLVGETRSLSGCTAARSTDEYYAGSYSYKITQTDASTGEYRFCDNVTKNDLHGLYPGTQYKLSAYTYLLATGSPTTAEVKLIVGYTTDAAGAWHETSGNVTTDHDAWGLAATTNVAIPSGAVGAKALVRIKAAASTDEYIFIDNVRLQPIGTHNLHSQNFYDAGSNTYIGV